MTLSKFRFVSVLLFASYKVASPFTVHPSRPPATVAFSRHSLMRLANKASKFDDEHLAHGLAEVHEETNEELLESERAAAEDAHDSIDAGMEAAAEERAVMIAHDMIHKMKGGEQPKTNSKWSEEHLAHGIAQVHEETDEELLESEQAAAQDAHDSMDAGMEAAAEERAVMLANELIHEMREKALKNKKTP